MNLVYDQEKIDIGASFAGEEHALLGTLIDVAMARMSEVRFIQISPVALTLLQSGITATRNSNFELAIAAGAKAGPAYDIGRYRNAPLTLAGAEDHSVRVLGTNGECEVIELKNIRFI